MEGRVLLRRFASGQGIVEAGDRAEALFIVQSGEVEVREGGGPPRRLGPGEMFGEIGLILGEPYGLEAIASTESALVVVELEDLHKLCLSSPDFSFRLIRHLAEQVRSQPPDERSETRERGARLARVILELAAEGETPARVDGRLRDLADAAELPLPEAYGWVQRWLEQRTLRLADDHLTLVEREALSAVAQASSQAS
jgi:CRP-like cAMP-binding protein